MKTYWSAFALEDNVLFADVLIAYGCRVMLSPIPGVPTSITLPANARVVRFYTTQDVIRYAVAPNDPQLLTTTSDLVLDFNAFREGDSVQPGQWQAVALPDDSLPHEVRLASDEALAVVLVIALLDGLAA